MPKQDGKKTGKTARKTTARAASTRTPRGAATAPAPLTRERLIAELNDDLAKEFQALIQYVQHSAVITGPQYDAIRVELAVHSNEEHAHAISLSEQIDFLGGTPGVDVAQVRVSDVAKVMLEQDLEGELDAIARYKARIAQAEQLQEYGLRRALEDILMVEEEHARDLQNALDL
ncbi:MAG TPA: ferritin-like domain-containing protein [Thermoleophilia bacterium]|nr:ferritin-like domain-containing protein [Thermoleophilia bacterium]